MDNNTCSVCGTAFIPTRITGGYGMNEKGDKVCFSCCGKLDSEYMKKHGKITLYLGKDEKGGTIVSNWPESLKIKVYYSRTGRHNWAHHQTTVYFTHAGENWMGKQYGSNSDLCYCRKIKG